MAVVKPWSTHETDDETQNHVRRPPSWRSAVFLSKPDFGPPLHLHRDTAEAFYVLEGEYMMYVQDCQQLCPPGTFVYVPRDTPHTFKVVSAIPGKKLVLFSPAAMLAYFEELAAAEAAGNNKPELLNAIAAQTTSRCSGQCRTTICKPEQRAKSSSDERLDAVHKAPVPIVPRV